MTIMWQSVCASIQNHPLRWLWWSTAIVMAYLSLGAVFGFDVCDNGQYMTFYSQIFSAPQTVSYHFMYYLSGVVGGAFLSMFPSTGLLGMRFLGLLCIAASMLATWRILKPHLSPTSIVVGNALSMAAFISLPVTFCYDILSILLYLLAIEQLLRRKYAAVFTGGVLLGINAFARTPNVLGFSFAFVPLLMAMCMGGSKKEGARLSAISGVGIAVGVAAVVALMMLLGHLQTFTDNLATLRQIAGDTSGEASHSVGALITQQLGFYTQEFNTWFKLASVIGVFTALWHRTTSAIAKAVLLGAAIAASAWMMWRMNSLQPIWAFCAFACAGATHTYHGEMRGVTVVALLLMLIFPLGSDSCFNNGSIILLLATPIAIEMSMRHRRMFQSAPFILSFAIICVIKMATSGAYFDGGPLWEKTSAIHSAHAKGIFTTPKRAAIINDALKGIKPWVRPADTMLVYGSMPMLNYLTDTRSALGCSWPELLTAGMLRKSLSETMRLPIVLRQKFTSIGPYFSEPSDSMLHSYGKTNISFYSDAKIAELNQFLTRNHYRCVYESTHFVLYIPPQKTAGAQKPQP